MVPWRTVFFAVNFGATVLFVIVCVASVGETVVGGGSPFAFAGAVCFAWPAIAFGVAEWFLHVRNARSLERPLGIVCGLVGGLAIFAFVSNAAESSAKGGSPGVGFWLGFGAICLAIALYGLWCCWLRVRRRTLPQARGFPVDRAAAP